MFCYAKPSKKEAYQQEKKAKRKFKLSFNDAKELKALPAIIEKMEAEIEALHAKMSEPDFYKNHEDVKKSKERLKKMESELEEAYRRWEELESLGLDQKG